MGNLDSLGSDFEIPTSIFWDRKIAVLEAISEYLKEKQELSYHEIAVLTNRDDRTIWTCYNRAKKKRKKRADHSSEVFIPVEILKDRKVSVLEKIVEYLKDKRELSYHEIAVLLNRDDRTVWTCYNRASKKRKAASRGGKK
jgi:predicted transcriptional regulator